MHQVFTSKFSYIKKYALHDIVRNYMHHYTSLRHPTCHLVARRWAVSGAQTAGWKPLSRLVSGSIMRWRYIQFNLVPLWSPKLVWIIFKNLLRTAKKTQHFTVTRINRLTLFKEIIAVYNESRKKSTKWSVIYCYSSLEHPVNTDRNKLYTLYMWREVKV
jgi:hypothetical protein